MPASEPSLLWSVCSPSKGSKPVLAVFPPRKATDLNVCVAE